MAIDRADWHWNDAENYYRINHGVSGELTDKQREQIWLYAADHIGQFLRWLIDRNFQSEDAIPEKVEKVRSGEMTGTELLVYECDGKLWEEDVKPDILRFVEEYYGGGQYFSDYGDCCLGEDKPLYGTLTSEEDYAELKKRIDTAFEVYMAERE